MTFAEAMDRMADRIARLTRQVRAALAESEIRLRKIDESRTRIKRVAGKMGERYGAATGKVADAIAERGIGADPELEGRHLRLLQSKHACDRVHGGSCARE